MYTMKKLAIGSHVKSLITMNKKYTTSMYLSF